MKTLTYLTTLTIFDVPRRLSCFCISRLPQCVRAWTLLFTWNMSTVSFSCRDCSTTGTTLRRNDIMPSLAMMSLLCVRFIVCPRVVQMRAQSFLGRKKYSQPKRLEMGAQFFIAPQDLTTDSLVSLRLYASISPGRARDA